MLGLLLTLHLVAADPPAAPAATPEGFDAARFAATFTELNALPHRLAGSPEGRAAGDLIIRQLRAAGIPDEQLIVQSFPVTQLALNPDECYFVAAGTRVQLQPLRPNGLALSVTPAEGLRGETVYLRNGHWEHFAGQDLHGKIAVLDEDCGDRWQRVLPAGASAVIFIAAEPTVAVTEPAPRWCAAHFAFPRFQVSAAAARASGLDRGATITVFSRLSFQPTEGRNILVLIPGTAPAPATADELVVFATNYDTFGPTPFATPAVAQAANVAGLVEAAAVFNRAPLPRGLVLAFFDDDAQQQLGQCYFHFARDAATDAPEGGTLSRLLAERAAEEVLLKEQLAVAANLPAVIANQSSKGAAARVRKAILGEAELLYDRRVTELSEARQEYNLLEARVERARQALRRLPQETAGLAPEEAARLEAQATEKLRVAEAARVRLGTAAAQRLEAATADREAIYGVRKLLVTNRVPAADAPAAVARLFTDITDGVTARWRARLAEEVRETALLAGHLDVGRRLGGRSMLAMVFWRLPAVSCRWTIVAPDPAAGGVVNLPLSNWLQERLTAAGKWPLSAGLIRGAGGPAAARVSGRTTCVLEFGAIGTVAPPAALPDVPAYTTRLAETWAFARDLAASAELSRVRLPPRLTVPLLFNIPRWRDTGTYDGCYVRRYRETTKAGEPLPGGVVLTQSRWATGEPAPASEWGGLLTASSTIGTFWLMLPREYWLVMNAAEYNDRGELVGISQRHPDGAKGEAGNWEAPAYFASDQGSQLVVFPIKQRIMVAGVRSPTGSVAETTVRFLDAASEAKPRELNLSKSGSLIAVYTGRLRQYKLLQSSQLLLNNTSAVPLGSGYEPGVAVVDAVALGAHDGWLLNEDRLGNLRSHQIMENALERLHQRAEELQDEAAAPTTPPGRAGALRLACLGYLGRVYEPVRAVTNDLVQAVVLLLLLAVPFAWAVERAVIGSPNIYRQLAGFAGLFGAVFAILYVVHPAFRFATFPLVVLLAFVIIIMSALVIAIMWGKFEYELRKLHGLAIASHQSTRNAWTTIMAAVIQGIATMRRRPLRTMLTAVTIVLLTFTILMFGSFRAEDGIRSIFVGPARPGRQVEIGSVPGQSFDPGTVTMLRALYPAPTTSYVRHWAVTTGEQVQTGRLPDDTVFTTTGYASIPGPDLTTYPALREALQGDLAGFAEAGGVFLPPALYERIPSALREAGRATITFADRQWVVRGTFDPSRLRSIRTLDGASFVPPDLEEVRRKLTIEYPRDPEAVNLRLTEMELEDFPPLDPTSILLLWAPTREETGGTIRSLVFLPPTDEAARQLASELATLLGRRASVAVGGEHYRFIYVRQLTMGGLAKVAIPLLLGGLIILGTMLSSVSDRQQEVFTFSALGLAPKHVAALFFAEAAVYAVVGGMGGYLLAHVFAKLAELLARQGLIEAPAMNHSSTNAMITILIVMATVLISTIYPAYRASRCANPGVQRRWRLPDPQGDAWTVAFPFTVSQYDLTGLVSFLEEHLLSHRDRSVGVFAADQVKVVHHEGRFTIEARVWLQPFDQGVSQTFLLRTRESTIAGIEEVEVELHRLTGSPTIWHRSVPVFIHDLRHQFILWRTIPDDAAEHYYHATSTRFGLASEEG